MLDAEALLAKEVMVKPTGPFGGVLVIAIHSNIEGFINVDPEHVNHIIKRVYPMSALQLIGLSLDGLGAVLVVLPGIQFIRDWAQPTKEISKLESDRVTFFTQEELTPEDEGFKEVIEALDGPMSIPGHPISLVITDRFGTWDGAEIRYESGGDSVYAVDDRVSPSLIDRYIERRITYFERRAESWFLRSGAVLLAFGFILQIAAAI